MSRNVWMLTLACVVIAGCAREAPDAVPPTATPATAPSGSPAEASAPAPEEPAEPPAELAEAAPLEDWSGAFNNVFAVGPYYFTGLPSEDGLRLAADEGVKVVVNLLTESQQTERITFDEPALMSELGLDYVTIPVLPDTFSKEDVQRFAEVVEHAAGPVLVHCASSNRCGGLWAAYLNLHRGVELERAIELGRSAGLRADSMVEAVRRVTAEP